MPYLLNQMVIVHTVPRILHGRHWLFTFKPRFCGGSNDPWNLVARCPSCNALKRCHSLDDFRSPFFDILLSAIGELERRFGRWNGMIDEERVKATCQALDNALLILGGLEIRFYGDDTGAFDAYYDQEEEDDNG